MSYLLNKAIMLMEIFVDLPFKEAVVTSGALVDCIIPIPFDDVQPVNDTSSIAASP